MTRKRKKMKKLYLFASFVLMCSALSGCRQISDTSASEAPAAAEAIPAETLSNADGLIEDTENSTYTVAEETLLADPDHTNGAASAPEAESEKELTDVQEAVSEKTDAADSSDAEGSGSKGGSPDGEDPGTDQAYGSPEADFVPDLVQAYLPPVYRLIPGYELIEKYQIRRPRRSVHALAWRLNKLLASYDGTWSICVKDLTTNEQLLINDVAMPSASLMKLFIMGCIYDEIRFGRMQRTSELVARLSGMIRASSNQDANQLLLMLGGGDYSAAIQWLNQYIHNAGYSDATIAYNPFQESGVRLDDEHVNQTTAADCALLLERIYRRTFGTRTACEEAEALMLSQGTRYKIPAGLPDSVQVGNKTGETNEVEHDAAVVYTPSGDYILTILSGGWSDKNIAQSHFKELSAEIYSYFSDPSYIDRRFPFLLPRE